MRDLKKKKSHSWKNIQLWGADDALLNGQTYFQQTNSSQLKLQRKKIANIFLPLFRRTLIKKPIAIYEYTLCILVGKRKQKR